MEFQSFEEMLEYDVNVKETIIAEEVNQVMQTVYFPTAADQRSRSRTLSRLRGRPCWTPSASSKRISALDRDGGDKRTYLGLKFSVETVVFFGRVCLLLNGYLTW